MYVYLVRWNIIFTYMHAHTHTDIYKFLSCFYWSKLKFWGAFLSFFAKHCLKNKNKACCDKAPHLLINLHHQSSCCVFVWKVHVYCLYGSGLWEIEACLILGVWVIPPVSVAWLMSLKSGRYVGKVFAIFYL